MISIVIIVKNDPRIDTLLCKLKYTTYPEKTEIIVVDASTEKHDEIKVRYPRVKWHTYTSQKHNKKTYSEQRNVGIRASKGNIIAFIDADCIPDKDWLVKLAEPIYKERENIVSGACRPLQKDYIHKEEQYGKYREECETMNVAVTREVIDRVGLFDENLGGCEDSDYFIRARKKGYKIRFTKESVVYHDWGGILQNMRRSFHGGKNRVKLYQKHHDLIFRWSINNAYTAYYLLYILFLPVTIYFPYYIFALFIPSVVKRRNPVKEVYNLCFTFGLIHQTVTSIIISGKRSRL